MPDQQWNLVQLELSLVLGPRLLDDIFLSLRVVDKFIAVSRRQHLH